ncbi:MAG TPA: 23S rRNA (pseudouridine(1915)-N(3))-methyltransferase RlmH [Acidiferrobacterales bacterium]|nr:23S rRNA (pseudouridine(1915)-N(3))-methyltransferase RlmH [Acidiferrobacterales bacterium]
MRIHIIAVGSRMPGWVDAAYQDYAKRMPAQCRVHLIEIPAVKRTKKADIERILQEEGRRLLAAVPAGSEVIALERRGKQKTTEQLAKGLQRKLIQGRDLALLIGGPEGLAPECLERAGEIWSLSELTLPHPLVRIMLVEQCYRAWSILNRLPYHRSD